MAGTGIWVPIKIVNGEQWGNLAAFAANHELCAEDHNIQQNYSFAGQHRVRLYKLKKNVHWKIPKGVELNISDIPPSRGLRRAQPM